MCPYVENNNCKRAILHSLEVESLCHLLHAQIHMCEWSYLPSVLQLQQAHTKLQSWAENIPIKEVTPNASLNFVSLIYFKRKRELSHR